jgi:hypothetical protein
MTMPGKRRIALGAALVLLLALAGGAGAEALNPQTNQSVPDAEKLEALMAAWEATYFNEVALGSLYAEAEQFEQAGTPQPGDIAPAQAMRAAVDMVLSLHLLTVDDLFYYTPECGYAIAWDVQPDRWIISLNPPLWMVNEGLYESLHLQFDAVTGQCIYLLVGGRG